MLSVNLKKFRRFSEILFIIKSDLDRSGIVQHAYAMAYMTLFSLIPSLAATFALVSLFIPMFGKHSAMINQFEEFILKHLATGSGEQAKDYLEKFLANTDFQKIGMTGFAFTVLALIFLLKNIEMALNRIFEIDRPRALLMRFIYFWTFLTLGTFSLALSIGTLSSSGIGAKYFDISMAQQIIGDILYFLCMYGFFFLIYKIIPNRFIPTRQSLLGAAIATMLLALAIKFFGLYIANFTSYQAVYGALSAMPIFLLWLYIIWFITLFGALITKRSMDGWRLETSTVEASNPHINEAYFHSLLPFLLLLSIYRSFEKNSGKGTTPELLGKELKVSLRSIRRALHILEEEALIVTLQTEIDSNFTRLAYFPRIPAHQITYFDLKRKLLGEENTWLNSILHSQTWIDPYYSLIQHFLVGNQRSLSEDLGF